MKTTTRLLLMLAGTCFSTMVSATTIRGSNDVGDYITLGHTPEFPLAAFQSENDWSQDKPRGWARNKDWEPLKDWARNKDWGHLKDWGHHKLVAPSAVPVPAAVWLFVSGLLGLVGIARRKKA